MQVKLRRYKTTYTILRSDSESFTVVPFVGCNVASALSVARVDVEFAAPAAVGVGAACDGALMVVC